MAKSDEKKVETEPEVVVVASNAPVILPSGSDMILADQLGVADPADISKKLPNRPPQFIFLPSKRWDDKETSLEVPKEVADRWDLEKSPVWHYTGMLYGSPNPRAYIGNAPHSDMTYGQVITIFPLEAERKAALESGLYEVISGSQEVPKGAYLPGDTVEEEKK